MNLRRNAFEKSLKEKALALINASSIETQEFHKAKKDTWWRQNRLSILVRIAFWIIAAILIYFSDEKNSGFIIAVVFLWSVALMFSLALSLYYHLYSPYYLLGLVMLPISEKQTFKELFLLFLSKTHWIFFDLLAVYTAFATHHFSFPMALCAGFFLAAFQGAFILALALILFALPLHCILQSISVFLNTLLWVFLMLYNVLYNKAIFQKICEYVFYIPPIGWASSLLLKNVHLSSVHYVSTISISLCVFCLASLAFIKIKTVFLKTLGSEQDLSAFFLTNQLTPTSKAPSTAVQQQENPIHGKLLTVRMNWENDGFLNRIACTLLSKREQTVLEFLSAGKLSLKKIPLKLLGFCILFICIFSIIRESTLFFFFMAIVALFFLVHVPYAGFLPSSRNGIQNPFHILYPISAKEMFFPILKINLLIYATCIPFMIIMMLAVFHFHPTNEINSIHVITKLILGGLLFQPLAVMSYFVFSTNNGRKVLYYLGLFLGLIIVLAFIILFILEKSYTGIWLLWGVNLLIILAITAYFLHILNHGKTDWLPKVQNQEFF